MSYTKTIICLANSRKISGRCIAGKEVLNGHYGEWIRPISKRPAGEISEFERRFENGESPHVLDIVTIPLIEHQPYNYQQENHLIDDEDYWEKAGTSSLNELAGVVDAVPDSLWINMYSSSNGINDRMPEHSANDLKNSLLLVQPDNLIFSVNVEGKEFGNGKQKVRCQFTINNCKYKLAVTDPVIESIFLKKKDGEYHIDESKVYLCVSISEPFKGYCYKLVASVIYK